MERKRLFVGGLFEGITESEVTSRFEPFGSVISVELAKPNEPIAYVEFESTPSQRQKLVSVYNNAKWKGKKLKIEEAKMDYKQRLAHGVLKHEAIEKAIEKARKKRVRCQPVVHAKDMAPVLDSDTLKDGWKKTRYGRALPVLNIRHPLTRKLISVDPQKYKLNFKRISNDLELGQVNVTPFEDATLESVESEDEIAFDSDEDDLRMAAYKSGESTFEVPVQKSVQEPLESVEDEVEELVESDIGEAIVSVEESDVGEPMEESEESDEDEPMEESGVGESTEAIEQPIESVESTDEPKKENSPEDMSASDQEPEEYLQDMPSTDPKEDEKKEDKQNPGEGRASFAVPVTSNDLFQVNAPSLRALIFAEKSGGLFDFGSPSMTLDDSSLPEDSLSQQRLPKDHALQAVKTMEQQVEIQTKPAEITSVVHEPLDPQLLKESKWFFHHFESLDDSKSWFEPKLFCRDRPVEDIVAEWEEHKDQLTQEYKDRHREGLRTRRRLNKRKK